MEVESTYLWRLNALMEVESINWCHFWRSNSLINGGQIHLFMEVKFTYGGWIHLWRSNPLIYGSQIHLFMGVKSTYEGRIHLWRLNPLLEVESKIRGFLNRFVTKRRWIPRAGCQILVLNFVKKKSFNVNVKNASIEKVLINKRDQSGMWSNIYKNK